MGVLFLRSKLEALFSDHELSLVTTLANTMAIALRNARILQSLRDATEKSRSARAEAERRVQLFQRYADFFESAADGMIVIDRSGQILFANPRAREIIGYTETARGSIDRCPVDPRCVFRAAITAGALAIIVAHNHPSGDRSPSREDRRLTERLRAGTELLGIGLLDHVIVTKTKFRSVPAEY
jgi:DNA repair protein RadC